MKQKILLSGITGLIGRNTARLLLHKGHDLYALVRPGTDTKRYDEFQAKINVIPLDLAETDTLKEYLNDQSFDTILHIGAVRGGRRFPQKIYFDVNVKATEQLMINALQNNSKFIFCSSVGVFGAIPNTLPANENTPRKEDNYYHFTKIRAESLIQNYVLKGLNAVVLRPAITYGPGDYGFPFTLIRLVDKGIFPLTTNDIKIHLTNIELISQAFYQVVEKKITPGTVLNIADSTPTKLSDLVNFISKELKGKPHKTNFKISNKLFSLGENVARFLHNELWTARFELISKSWYYDIEKTYELLDLKRYKTIPDFRILTNWYKGL